MNDQTYYSQGLVYMANQPAGSLTEAIDQGMAREAAALAEALTTHELVALIAAHAMRETRRRY